MMGAPGGRTGRDSNPRVSFPTTRFPGVRLKPLGHLSMVTRAREGHLPPLRPSAVIRYGQGGIRTHDTVSGMPVFETGSFNHSDTCPGEPRNLVEQVLKRQRVGRSDASSASC